MKEPLHVATNRLSTIPLDINSFTERKFFREIIKIHFSKMQLEKGRVYDYPEYEEIEEEEENVVVIEIATLK